MGAFPGHSARFGQRHDDLESVSRRIDRVPDRAAGREDRAGDRGGGRPVYRVLCQARQARRGRRPLGGDLRQHRARRGQPDPGPGEPVGDAAAQDGVRAGNYPSSHHSAGLHLRVVLAFSGTARGAYLEIPLEARALLSGTAKHVLDFVLPVYDYRGLHPLTEDQLIEWGKLDTLDAFFARYDNPITFEEVLEVLRRLGCRLLSADRKMNFFRTAAPAAG